MHNTTKPEPESLLSAHLDGELSAEERRAAEAAVATDPAAAEELRSLAGVRNLIAGLPRPAGPDLAPLVMDRLRNRTTGSRSGRPAARRLRIAALAAGVAAASIAFVVFRGERPQSPRRDLPKVATSAPIPAPVVAEFVGPPAPDRMESPADGTLVGTLVEVASAEPPAVEPPADKPAPPPIPELADGAEPLVFSVADRDPAAAREQVAALLGLSTHREFHQIELPAAKADGGDEPARPAVVFTATLDPNELATLRDRLASAFAETLQEGGPAPTLTAEWVEKGRVSTLPANPAGAVSFPQTKLAMQFRAGERRAWPEPPPTDDDAQDAGPPAAAPEPAAAGQPRPVLVWIVAAPAD